MAKRFSGLMTPRRAFFLILALTMLPLVIFPLESFFYQELHRLPRIENGVLDLAGCDFGDGQGVSLNGAIPLNGEWEFYWNRWIVTDMEEGVSAKPDLMAQVPNSWRNYQIDGKPLPAKGYASYRLLLKNCPDDVLLVSYVPNLGEAYRTFLNGRLIAASGELSKNPDSGNVAMELNRERFNLQAARDCELVVEVSSANGGGLHLSPILAEEHSDFIQSHLRYMIVSVYVGILLVTIVCYLYLLLHQKPRLFSSVALLLLDIMMLLRLLVKQEMFGLLKTLVPFFRYQTTNVGIQVISLFLPAIFLICARDLWGVPLKRPVLRGILVFELVCCVPLYWFSMVGRGRMQFFISLIGFFPYLFVIRGFYQSLTQKVPGNLLVFTSMMLTISSLLGASESGSGFIVFNSSLFAPTAFIMAALLQVYLYLRQNLTMQKEALEAANLRARLRENEMTAMRNQIKPHFLYNALLAIQVLCTREPETAAEAVTRFSKYLRANMQFIMAAEPIPFTKELEHVQNYVSIERLRFRERLQVNYDIESQDFSVPPLTIQPLVENAIVHGACKNMAMGTVTLRTRPLEDGWLVEVIDDGPGFDRSVLERQTESQGLRNVIYRLREAVGAQVVIHSGCDQGTRVEVTIPQRGEETHAGDHCG